MVTAEEIFRFAEACLSGNETEVKSRQAAARAYYSVMLLVRDHLLPPAEVPLANTHSQVKAALDHHVFSGAQDQFLIMAHDFWEALKDTREQADYYIKAEFKVHKARESVWKARQVLKKYNEEK